MRPASRRWLIVAALFVVTFGMSTPLAAYGVFLPILAEAFGWSRGAIATALSINLLLGGVAGLAFGPLADRHGPRAILTLTVALAGASFALVSMVGELWHLYALVGVIGGAGMSTFYLLGASTVSRWFDERRGLALALVLVGFNLGYISAGPLAAWLIESVGWRAAYALLGAGSGTVALLAALSVRLPRASEEPRRAPRSATGRPLAGGADLPPRASSGFTLRQALVDPRLWYMNVCWFLLGGLALMISVHIVPFAHDQGVSLAGASLALTAYGIGSVTGRVASGAVSDRLGTLTTVRAGFVLQVIALTALAWVPSREVLWLSLAVFGAGFAAADTMITRVIPDVFGLRAIGAIMGVLTFGWRSGAAAAPAAAGFVHDATGSYALPFGAAPVVVLVSWGLFALASPRSRH